MRECGIVRDLLPLYQEGMLSPDSVEFLEEHLKTCPACRARAREMVPMPQYRSSTVSSPRSPAKSRAT